MVSAPATFRWIDSIPQMEDISKSEPQTLAREILLWYEPKRRKQ
jgi:hypothetical protein